MKSWIPLLLAFAAGINATALDKYKAVCDSPPTTEKQIEADVHVTYYCSSRAGPQIAGRYTRLTGDSPEECALACANRKKNGGNECLAALWNTAVAKPCFAVEDASYSAPESRKDSLLMVIRDTRSEDEDLFPEDQVLFPEETLEDCQKEVEQLREELKACCKKPEEPAEVPEDPSGCGFPDETTITENGKNFKTFCDRHSHAGPNRETHTVNSVRDCIAGCAQQDWCKRVVFSGRPNAIGQRTCYYRDYVGALRAPTTARNNVWSEAVQQDA